MIAKTNEPHPSLKVVHICEECGAAFTHSQVPEDVTVTGTIKCPACGHIGGLHVEVREAPDENLN